MRDRTAPMSYYEIRANELTISHMTSASTEVGGDGLATCHRYLVSTNGATTTTLWPYVWRPQYIPDVYNDPMFENIKALFNSTERLLIPINWNLTWHNTMNIQLPPEVAEWIASLPEVAGKYPDLAGCHMVIGDGDPSVHIIATELTAKASTTIMVPGNLDITQTSDAVITGTPPAAGSTVSTALPSETRATNTLTTNTAASQAMGYGNAIQSLAASTPSTSTTGTEHSYVELSPPVSTLGNPPLDMPSTSSVMSLGPAQSKGIGQLIQSIAMSSVIQPIPASERSNSRASVAPTRLVSTSSAMPTQAGALSEAATSAQTIPLGSSSIAVIALSTDETALPASHTMRSGEATTFNDGPLSLLASPTAIIAGSPTVPLAPFDVFGSPMPTAAVQSINVGSQVVPVVALSSGGIVLPGDKTVPAGQNTAFSDVALSVLPGQATTLNGAAMSLPTTTSALVIGTITIPPVANSLPISSAGVGNYILSSLAAPRNSIFPSVSKSAMTTLVIAQSPPVPTGTSPSAHVVVTAGSQTLTLSYALSYSGLILPNGQTLTNGGATTLDGIVLTIPNNATSSIGRSTQSGSLSSVITLGGSTVPVATPTGRTTPAATSISSAAGDSTRMRAWGLVLVAFVLVGMSSMR